jgi:hypothetical protein
MMIEITKWTGGGESFVGNLDFWNGDNFLASLAKA